MSAKPLQTAHAQSLSQSSDAASTHAIADEDSQTLVVASGVHEERSEARGRGEDSARGAEGGARSDHEGTTSAHPWPSPCSFSSGESTTELMRPKLDVRVDSTTSRARDARRSAHIVHVRWYTSDEKIPSGENQCCSRAPARLL
ncbi:unnamed protein product [Prorocentrum cordatum]|uniref:Uncharacterized protein n=1 Tax=Prorocentrum cordatum TaxID=2364126 RepID=A0ABN9U3B4_9DINO|nr:unnamed protein product [Polarella glacialis]